MSLAPGLCLVTGATGFVGSAVARALLSGGHEVRVLARPGSDRRNLADLTVEIAEGLLEDAPSLARAVAGCRYLFHVAADYRLWVPDPAPMYRANVEGTRVLMRAALDAGVERVVYTSSVATLGLVAEGSADEETPSSLEDMIGPYKRSKFQAEEVVRDLIERRGVPAVIVNPSTPVGPRDRKPTPTGRLILEAARGHMPGYVDTGLNIAHVEDVALGHIAAAETGRVGERYILGGEDMSLAQILVEVGQAAGMRPPRMQVPYSVAYPAAIGAELIARLTGREPFITRDGVRMARKKMYFSSAKAARELGYAPRPAREAIADAVGWFRVNGYL
ncbi:MAG: NAD-dependent epimerase/dehydratase family protein [Alphaproteobacteria bacterium]|nr:MAG: NAD-dependent epimerase/dehydratase family protein [Alphaproteobacteria bacterium]